MRKNYILMDLRHRSIPLLISCVFILTAFNLQGQDQTVTGKVTVVEDGSSLPGVNVVIKGTTQGTITDGNGKYSINVPSDGILIFSYLGFKSQEVNVNARSIIDIALETDIQALEEVVVVGYGTQRKSDLTGAIASIDGEELQKSVFANLDQALQGRVPGVQITSNSGAPGGATSIRIRGTNSLTGSNEPLYVIDGVQFQGDAGQISGFDWAGGAGGQQENVSNPLAQLNPNDIESIEVLKDASATAIYGSRASNGVVIITTKRGKSGESKVSYSGFYGVQMLPTKIDVMDLREYAAFNTEVAEQIPTITVNERYLDPSILGKGTDWQEEIFETAPMQSHQLTFSGGNDNTQFAFMNGYFNQDGIVIGSGFDRFTTRLNLDSKIKEWLKFSANLSYSMMDETITLNDGGDGVIAQAFQSSPATPVKDIDGNYAGPTQLSSAVQSNPVGLALLRNNSLERQNLNANFNLQAQIIEGLNFVSEMGFSTGHALSKAFVPTYEWGVTVNSTNQLKQREENNFFWLFKNYFTYTKNFDAHNFTAMVGMEALESNYNGSETFKINFASNDIQVLSGGENSDIPTNGWEGSNTLNSYFGRLNYNYDNRYLVTFTMRADGSSRFGPNNRWGYFPSAAVKWRIINESFMPSSETFSDLGLRLGYGETGNQEIENYAYGSALRSLNSAFGTAYINDRIANPDVKWEATKQINIGLDLGVWDNRLTATVDFYKKFTDDLLLEVPIPNYLGGGGGGINPPYANVGSMENQGVELGLHSVNISNADFSWTSDLNFTMNRNKITDLERILTEGLYWYAGFDEVTRTEQGGAVGLFYGYVMEGIFTTVEEIENSPVQVMQQGSITPENPNGVNFIHERDGLYPGDIKFKDINGDGVIDSGDKTIIGDPNPDFSFGFTNNFSYKNFDLTIFLNGVFGYDIFNYSKVRNERMDGIYNNQAASIVNRARVELDGNGDPYVTNAFTNIPRFSQLDVNENDRMSSRWIEDGSYIRIQNVKLAYSLPVSLTSRFGIERFRVYVNAQNVYTFTNYSGYDPEIGAFNQNALRQNLDMGRYPTPRVITFGLDLGI